MINWYKLFGRKFGNIKILSEHNFCPNNSIFKKVFTNLFTHLHRDTCVRVFTTLLTKKKTRSNLNVRNNWDRSIKEHSYNVILSNCEKDSADMKWYERCIRWEKIKVQNSKYCWLSSVIKMICECIHVSSVHYIFIFTWYTSRRICKTSNNSDSFGK